MSSEIRLLAGAAAVMLFAPGAHAQERVRQCQNTVASRLNISPADVQATTGPRLSTGNFLVTWNALAAGDDVRGYCKVSLDGRVTHLQIGDYNGAIPAGGNHSPASSQAVAACEQACRTQAAQRLNEPPENVSTEPGASVRGRTRIRWKSTSGRTGFCVLDRSFNMAEFREQGKGSAVLSNAKPSR